MARQMSTHEVHYTTEDYRVVTQTGFVKGKRVYEIAVVSLSTGREEFRNVDSIEKAIRLCDKEQAELEKLRADLAAKQAGEATAKQAAKTAQTANHAAEAAKLAEDAATKAIGPLATDRQVDYIMSLLAQHGGQNTTWFSAGPTTLKEVSRMTRRDASTYISALKGDY